MLPRPCLWVWLCVCPFTFVRLASSIRTVSYFDHCDTYLIVDSGDSLKLRLLASDIPKGKSSCRVKVKCSRSRDRCKVRCRPEAGSSVGPGVELKIETQGGYSKEVYTKQHWISGDFVPRLVPLYIFNLKIANPWKPTKINLTFHVTAKEHKEDGPSNGMSGLAGAAVFALIIIALLVYYRRHSNTNCCDLVCCCVICVCDRIKNIFTDCHCRSRRSSSSSESSSSIPSHQSSPSSNRRSVDLSSRIAEAQPEQVSLTTGDNPPAYESCMTSYPGDNAAELQPSAPPAGDVYAEEVGSSVPMCIYNISSITNSDLSGDTDDGLPSYHSVCPETLPPTYEESLSQQYDPPPPEENTS